MEQQIAQQQQQHIRKPRKIERKRERDRKKAIFARLHFISTILIQSSVEISIVH